MKFPLKINSEISFVTTLDEDFSYIQSIRESLSRQVPGGEGVGRLRSVVASSVLEKS